MAFAPVCVQLPDDDADVRLRTDGAVHTFRSACGDHVELYDRLSMAGAAALMRARRRSQIGEGIEQCPPTIICHGILSGAH